MRGMWPKAYNDLLLFDLANSEERAFLFHCKSFAARRINYEKINFGVIQLTINPPIVEKVIPILIKFFTVWDNRPLNHTYLVISDEEYRVYTNNEVEIHSLI